MTAIILFDGVCDLCNATVNFIIDQDHAGYFKFATQQRGVGQALLAQHKVAPNLDSIILILDGQVYQESTAAAQIAKHLPQWAWAGRLLLFCPVWLRDRLYRLIARNRYRWFGQQETCRLPSPALRSRFLEDDM